MTDEKTKPGSNEQDDRKLAEALHGAFEQMNPTPEQEARMLATLQEAQGEALGTSGPRESMGGEDSGATATTSPTANRSRGWRGWKVALPLAACLVVGAVAVGVANQTGTPSQDAASTFTASTNASSVRASEAENESEGADGEMQDELGYMADEDMTTEGTGALTSQKNMIGATEESYLEDVIIDEPPDDLNTEEYNALQERGFVSTKASPLSTVSADVDTASYCNVRRMVNDGYALSDIPAGAVRIEEMLNYFDYGYATPAAGAQDKFSMQAQVAPCPWNPDTQLLVLGFATQAESQAASKGANLVFLVDVSGSMNDPDKLELLQDSFATLLEGLGPDDRVSIVTYANGEDIVLEGARGDDDKEILRAIYKLHAEGSTNGEAGLKQAYEVAERNFIEGGVNRIIMASDGDLNVGMTSESELYDFVDGKRGTGIYLSVLGFGSGNYKDNKMEVLADHGNGSYHYIDCIEEAERVLREKLCANLVPFADDVKVQVEFNPAQVKGYRLIGYDNRVLADEDFRDDTVDAGDVGPNQQFTVAYEVVPADSKMEIAEPELKYGSSAGAGAGAGGTGAGDDWLTCTMRYHVFDGDAMHEQQLVVGPSAATATPSDDWKFAAAVIEFGMLARDSKYAGTANGDSILELLGTNLADDRDAFKRLVTKAC